MSSKQTRKALFSSFWALLLCFAMLLGTTFAWFTDTASTSVNKIQAGNLKIELGMYDDEGNWTNYEGKTLTWVKADNGEEVLWEPGCSYALEPVMIRNNGNLALQFKVDVTGIKGSAKLNEAIEWTVDVDHATAYDAVGSETINTVYYLLPGECTSLVIGGHMKEEAGNEYQGLSIDGVAITVYATQWTYESDSTGNQYDAGATLPSIAASDVTADTEGLTNNTDVENRTVKIESVGQLVAFAEKVKSNNTYFGYTVTLESDIDLGGVNWSGIGANNYSDFPSYFFNGTFDGQGHTIYNMTVSNLVGNESTAGFFNGLGNNAIVKNLNFENANVTSNHQAGVVAGYCCTAAGNGVVQEPKASIENCHVNNSTVISKAHGTGSNYDDGDKVGGIIGYTFFTVKDCSVKNTTIVGYRDIGGIVGYANANGYSAAAVTGNSVENVTIFVDKTHDYKDYTSNDAYDAHSIIGEKASSVTESDNNGEATIAYGVSDSTSLASALSLANNTVYLPSGNYEISSAAIASGVTVIGSEGAKVSVATSEGYKRIYSTNATFKNVVFEGDGNLWFKDTATFIDCTFNTEIHDAEPVVGTVTFKGCTFNKQAHFAPASAEADTTGKFFKAEDCTFNANLIVSSFENVKLTDCELKGSNWAGKNMISYCPLTLDGCTFTTGIRLSYSDTSNVTCTNGTVDLSWSGGSATVGSN